MARRTWKKFKKPGFLFDENVPSELAEYALFKGFKTLAIKDIYPSVKDQKLAHLLKEWVLISRDKGWLKAGRVPRKHRGVIVLDAGQGHRETLDGLFIQFLIALEAAGVSVNSLEGRRFLWGDKLAEIASDGSQVIIYPKRE